MNITKDTEVIHEARSLQHHLEQMAKELPSLIRVPYVNFYGNFNVSYNLLAGYKDHIYFYQNDPADRDRVSASNLEKGDSGLICPFSVIQKKIWIFECQVDQIQRVTEQNEKEELLRKIKLQSNVEDVFLKPAILNFKKDFFNQDFLEIISFPIPQKIYKKPQKRNSPRVIISEKLNHQFKIAPPRANRAAITGDLNKNPRLKTEITRFWNFTMTKNESIANVFMEFFDRISQCIFSPYFNLDQVLKPKPSNFEAYEHKVTNDYDAFEKIKAALNQTKNPILSHPKLIIPLIIYNKLEGHFIFMNVVEKEVTYLSKMTEVIALRLLAHPKFRINSDVGNQSFIDISHNGLRFRSDQPAHKKLKCGTTFTCEFNLHWASPLPISIQVTVIRTKVEKNNDGTESYDITCTYLKGPESNDGALVRIKKFVDDHTNYASC